MKKIITGAFILICTLLSNIVEGQNNKLDSLDRVLKTQADDTAKVRTLLTIIGEWSNKNADTSIYYANEIMKLSNKLNYDMGIATGTLIFGYIYLNIGKGKESIAKNEEAIKLYDQMLNKTYKGKYGIDRERALNQKVKALKYIATVHIGSGNYSESLKQRLKLLNLNKELNDEGGIALTYNDIGNIYSVTGDYPQALKYYYMSLKIRDKLNDEVGAMYVHGNIANIHVYQNNYAEALISYRKCLKIQLKTDDKKAIGDSYINIAGVYVYQNNIRAALSNLAEAFKLYKEIGNERGIANYYLHLGAINFEMDNYGEALENLDKGEFIAERLGDKGMLNQLYHVEGQVFMEQKNYVLAAKKFDQNLALAKEIESIEHMEEGYKSLAMVDSAMGNYKNAFENYKMHIQLRDSLYGEENTKKIVQSQMQYEFDKKEANVKAEQVRKDAIMATELKNNTTIRNYTLAALLLSIITAFLIFNQYRITKKSNIVIAQQKQIAEEQRKRAEESERFKSRFLANMTHEIRTPMNAVLGMTNLLLKTHLDSKQHTYLDAVQKSSRNLLVIINDILDLSKIEVGKIHFEKIHFSLNETLDVVYSTLRFKAEEKSLKFTISVDSSVPEVVIGDPVRLSQVLINLGSNAIKFTEKGSVNISVNRANNREATNDLTSIYDLEFKITDTGIGIASDQLSNVFEGFSQADKSTFRKYGGTGLGLSISKQLIELQDGTITVESELNKGSTFSFSIPYESGSKIELASKTPVIDNSIINKLGKLKILLAEDNMFNQIVAADTLKILIPGIQVDIANNGMEAVEMVKKNQYDLILMDVNMPEMNGLEATKIIRSIPSTYNNLKIVAMTASITREEIKWCYDSGMDDFIPKPFEQDELIEKIIKITRS